MQRSLVALSVIVLVAGCGEATVPPAQHAAVTSPNHDCAKAPNVSIEANDGTFNLTSACDSVVIKGAGNKIRIEGAKRVEINGPKNVVDINAVDVLRANSAGNTIRYKKGLTKQRSDVVAIGDNNSIVQE